MIVDDHDLHRLVCSEPTVSGAATAALWGDHAALAACEDYLTEFGGRIVIPFEVGNTYFIETQTLYYVGRVKEIVGAFVVLEDASWVHWTGRKSVMAKHKSFAKKHFVGAQSPRTEYVGDYVVSLSGIIGFIPGGWELPKESIQ
jgi:hypothetical protein